jgi:magnesium chelatase family protein
MDRVDLEIEVPRIKYEKLVAKEKENLTQEIRERVIKARKIQEERFKKRKTNAQMDIPDIKRYCQLDSRSQTILKKYVDSGFLSVRGYHRVLKVARTIADLDNSENISFNHLSEALMYRIREG